jgi:hypothetical protein
MQGGAWKPLKIEPVELIDRVADVYVQATRLKAFAPDYLQVSNTRFTACVSPFGDAQPALSIGCGVHL